MAWTRTTGRKAWPGSRDWGWRKTSIVKSLPVSFISVELHSTRDATAVQRAAAMAEGDSLLRVLWVLKDADGLDRVRIYDLDAAQLRYAAAREREAEAWRLLEEMG
jgi:hypothetical protein